ERKNAQGLGGQGQADPHSGEPEQGAAGQPTARRRGGLGRVHARPSVPDSGRRGKAGLARDSVSRKPQVRLPAALAYGSRLTNHPPRYFSISTRAVSRRMMPGSGSSPFFNFSRSSEPLMFTGFQPLEAYSSTRPTR